MKPNPDDLTLPEQDRRELIVWASACVERLIPVNAMDGSDDARLRDALRGAHLFSMGELGVGPMRKLAFGCHAVAREAPEPAAAAVARACGQAVAVAHMAGHSREIQRYTRKALSGEQLDRELDWQRTHVPHKFEEYVYPPMSTST